MTASVSAAAMGLHRQRPPALSSSATTTTSAEGFLGGAQIGYNWQFTPGNGFVVGVEADIQGIDLDRDNGDHRLHVRPGGVGIGLTDANFVAGSQQRQQPRLLRHGSRLASAMPSTASWFTAPAASPTAAATATTAARTS